MIQIRLPWGRKANLHAAWDTDFVLGGDSLELWLLILVAKAVIDPMVPER
jgi:hypothetical protein